jgi:preprotein translocase subunit SecG
MLEAIFSWYTLRILMWILYVPACLGLIAIVLLQKGKGTGFAGAFGMGAGSEAVFGPRASRSLPVKLTYVMAGVFVVLAFGLTVVEGKVNRGEAPELIEETEETASLPNTELTERLGEAYGGEEPEMQPEEPEAKTASPAETEPVPEATPTQDAQELIVPAPDAAAAGNGAQPEEAPAKTPADHGADTGS